MTLDVFPHVKKQQLDNSLKTTIANLQQLSREKNQEINRKASEQKEAISRRIENRQQTIEAVKRQKIDSGKSRLEHNIKQTRSQHIGSAVASSSPLFLILIMFLIVKILFKVRFFRALIISLCLGFFTWLIFKQINRNNEDSVESTIRNLTAESNHEIDKIEREASEEIAKIRAGYSSECKEIDNARSEKIVAENKACREKIEKATKECNDDYRSYYAHFFVAVDEAKERFAGSKSADTIANNIMNWDFGSMIEAADRRNSLERIEIPFAVKVYKDQVTFDGFENGRIVKDGFCISFNECRFENLKSPVEQVALGYVLSSKLELLVRERFPQDPSGTFPTIKTNYRYVGSDAFCAELTYLAPNGNFIAKQSW